MTLDDADTSTADVFDFDLVEGPNVVKVKVTGEDGTTTETYTVEIRRAEADLLVSNLGQARIVGFESTLVAANLRFSDPVHHGQRDPRISHQQGAGGYEPLSLEPFRECRSTRTAPASRAPASRS